jgi:hypothetical protein
MPRRIVSLSFFVVSIVLLGHASATERSNTVSLKGKVIRSDTKQPIANASIILLDEKKSEKVDNSVETKSDAEGNYVFEKVVPGKYTVSIRAWYATQEDAPCQLLMAKTSDKDSSVMVARDKDKFVQQVFIKGFAIKSGKELVKDFDFACKSMFGG